MPKTILIFALLGLLATGCMQTEDDITTAQRDIVQLVDELQIQVKAEYGITLGDLMQLLSFYLQYSEGMFSMLMEQPTAAQQRLMDANLIVLVPSQFEGQRIMLTDEGMKLSEMFY